MADSDRVADTTRRASAWAENCHEAYLQAGPTERKLINQAFFARVLVTEEGVVGWEYNEPFALLMSAHGAPSGAELSLVVTGSTEPGASRRGERTGR